MKSLVHRLLMMRVRPYYLYQCDLITGSAHLRTDVSTGIKLIQQLRGHTTGYAVPQYVIDAPGGGGKVPINPEYVQKITDSEVVLRNYEGKTYKYPLVNGVPVPLPIPCPRKSALVDGSRQRRCCSGRCFMPGGRRAPGCSYGNPRYLPGVLFKNSEALIISILRA